MFAGLSAVCGEAMVGLTEPMLEAWPYAQAYDPRDAILFLGAAEKHSEWG